MMRRTIPETPTPMKTKLHIEGQSGRERAGRISSIFSIRQRSAIPLLEELAFQINKLDVI